jgi:glycine hydroxymethyltransferase
MFDSIKASDPDIYNLILAEQERQRHGMELIASENYQSAAVLEAQSSVFRQ